MENIIEMDFCYFDDEYGYIEVFEHEGTVYKVQR